MGLETCGYIRFRDGIAFRKALGESLVARVVEGRHQAAVQSYAARLTRGATMRIFASWSGEASKQVAELFRTWIPQVVQDVDVYVSSQDIGKGERWLSSVGANLAEIDFGLVLVTKSNINAPWILFEAGALSKTVKGVVVPILCGVENLEAARSPLTQFQYAHPTKVEIRDLIVQINSFTSRPLDQSRLEAAFEKWWPDFEATYGKIKLPDDKPPKKESEADRLSNIEEALSQLMFETRRARTLAERSEFVAEANRQRRAPAPDQAFLDAEVERQRLARAQYRRMRNLEAAERDLRERTIRQDGADKQSEG